ncbi:sulfatase-like hydrolase/transferase [Candidatus Poribacteria bacterium]|nr:sulfatase-like hydrolase/transferase [Candidatus Poribacteria bacterium]MYG06383.1 sulfatase-like hydrolase/transferase [Candidatus Poribacteria bacterium]MYK21663.1 sulfatase-like hydrolase/transferase [Candidatus Poribacteria bacterium]
MSSQPNVLFMIADDHRWDAIGGMGDPTVKTPTMDSLMARGTTFRQTHIMGSLSGAVCVPSRAAVLTSASLFRSGANQINRDYAVWPQVMRQAGYHTFFSGKWHNDRQTFADSFDDGGSIFFGGMGNQYKVPIFDFDPTGKYPQDDRYIGDKFSTELFTDSAVQFIENYDQTNPFFLYLSFTSPHDPRTPPGEYATMYKPEDVPVPENFYPEHPFDNGEMRIRDEVLAEFPRTPEIVQQHIADYYGMITSQDAEMGRLLNTLEANGHLDNTIVIYTADHGLAVGQHGLLGKQNLYDHSICVPSIFAGPGIPEGTTVDALTYLYDVFPTVCDLTSVECPDTTEGSSLVPLMEGCVDQVRPTVFAAYKDIHRTVSDGHWKLIRYYVSEETGKGTDYIQLFDLEQDPWETTNLAELPEHTERIQSLAAEMKRWQTETDDFMKDTPILLQ